MLVKLKIIFMKKIFIIFLLFFLSFSNIYASECRVENKTSDTLEEYIQNFRTVLKNIESFAKSKAKSDDTLSKSYSFAVDFFNEIFSFDFFVWDVNLVTFWTLQKGLPEVVYRDYERLKSEEVYQKEIVTFIWKKWLYSEKISSDLCKWVTNCSVLDWENLWDFVKRIWKNHEEVKKIFSSISLNSNNYSKKDVILISEKFFSGLETDYWKSAEQCSKNWWFEEMMNKISSVSDSLKYIKDWANKWKEAWEKASWILTTTTEKQKAVERWVLQKELQRQWVDWDSQQNMFEALDKFNQNWMFGYSLENNFLTNSAVNSAENFKWWWKDFKEDTTKDFFQNYENNTTVLKVSNIVDNSIQVKETQRRLEAIYWELSTYSTKSEINADNLRTKLINTHTNLSDSIKRLRWMCKVAVKICNQQDTWNWDCWDCNW